jgi:hypothetical protein
MTGDLFENQQSALPKPTPPKGSLKEYVRKALDEGQPKYRIAADMRRQGYAESSIHNTISVILREGKPKSSKGRKLENARSVKKLIDLALDETDGDYDAARSACRAAADQIVKIAKKE